MQSSDPSFSSIKLLLAAGALLLFSDSARAQQHRKRTTHHPRRVHAPPIEAPMPEPQEIMVMVDRPPSFPGLQHYLDEHLRYPDEARSSGMEGRVLVAFLINAEGSIGKTLVHRSSGSVLLDNEALRVIGTMPKWRPAEKNGRLVSSSMLLPVVFRLHSD